MSSSGCTRKATAAALRAAAAVRGLGWLAAACLGLIAPAGAQSGAGRPAGSARSADRPFQVDTVPGRLPKDVVPLEYVVEVVPDVDHLSLSGSEMVELEFRAATATVQFNSLNEQLHDVSLDGAPVKSVVVDDERQLTTVMLLRAAPAGHHTLRFRFTGKIETQPRGLFVQPYRDVDGKERRLLSTQMESTDARRMFPCWDEPAFRAIFRLRTTQPAVWATISNMPVAARVIHGALATTTFEPTPKMPSYLLEFTTGDLAAIRAESGGVRFGVWAVHGKEQQGATALSNAQTILADYDDYFAFPFPLPKLDSIAIPGGFPGAMENWGAITYNDRLLLLGSHSTMRDRQSVFATQAHEMAHQWNGDLVTMAWWDDIWLNESFASWMSAKETALRHPDWNWWEEQDEEKEEAMSTDAHLGSHAIQQHVTDELEAMNAFDPQITYQKGEAILRMFEAYLDPEVFRRGVRAYVKARAYSNATTADLWNALSGASGRDFGAIAAGWTEQAGFPLVTMSTRCDVAGVREIRLAQRRFLLSGEETNAARWRVPLRVRSGVAGTAQSVLLTEQGQTLEAGRCDEPLSLDADAIGFYRVEYDPATFEVDAKYFGRLLDGDRIALLDDQWALIETGTAPLASYLGLAASMGGNLDTRAWSQIVSALETIEFAERGTPGHEAFEAYARSMLKPVLTQVGFNARPNEPPDVLRLRRSLIIDLGTWGDREVLEQARARFAAFLENPSAISPDEQSAILSLVAYEADSPTFQALLKLARSAPDVAQQRRYFGALMYVRNPELAARAAEAALSPAIPPQAEFLRLSLIAQLAHEHPRLSWRTFTANADRLLAADPSFAPLFVAGEVPEIYWNGVPLADIATWVRGHAPAEMSTFIERGLETARFRLAEKARLVGQADAFLLHAGAKRGVAGDRDRA